ncbi:MAG: BrnA antitoxin family protein [Treponema sp.]|jgi:uncharacterized protein (DUF4415 family)|nr:BrnA antitoxin family protein [Treponema sp.]
MGMVKRVIDFDNYHFSEESITRLKALDDRPIDYSDIPQHTVEQIREGRRLAIEMRKKQMFSLRLPTSTIEWWKSFGSGYTGIMARLLEEARNHPEWIKKCL